VSLESLGAADRLPAVAPVALPSSTGAAGRAGDPRTESPAAQSFGTVLNRHLAEPQADIAAIRSEIAAVRSGAPFVQRARAMAAYEMTGSVGGLANVPGWLEAQLASQATGDTADPYGWRQASRTIAERVIGPGYGALFERQIQQESGFLPDVVYGTRVSSAGAEGIAQLMPQYYPHVARTDPIAGLQAGAETMRHYLDVWNGDVRRALASYNAGLGRVQSLVAAHGANWESGLPHETRSYLDSILGGAAPNYTGVASGPTTGAPDASDVFGGRGPGGVLTAPIGGAATRTGSLGLRYAGVADAAVRAPSDGVVVEAGAGRVVIDHGNGWRSTIGGVEANVAVGTSVRRSQALGTSGSGIVDLDVTVNGQAVDARKYVLGAS